jgi:hypothetical protein
MSPSAPASDMRRVTMSPLKCTPTHELQRLGGWHASVMVERYTHLAPDHLAKAANRLDSLLGGYDLATSEQQ